jgi:hypothetical protein
MTSQVLITVRATSFSHAVDAANCSLLSFLIVIFLIANHSLQGGGPCHYFCPFQVKYRSVGDWTDTSRAEEGQFN